MKTIMNKSGFAWCILLALAFTGCQGDQEGKHHFDNKVFISAASYTPEVRVMRDALDVTEEQTCEITVAMAQPVAKDITVSFAEAPELLDRYRTFYDDPTAQLLPSDGGYYDFSQISAVIRTGLVESEPLAFTFKKLDKLPIENKERYVLPMTIVSADGMEVLASARTVYFVFMKAALVNVVVDMNENCAWPNWTSETEAVKDMEQFSFEALVYGNSFKKEVSTIMGIEDVFLLRVGDADIPMNQVQVAFCTKDEGSTYRGYITSSSLKLQLYRWYHIAVTFDKGNICVYLDGKLKASGQTVTDKKDEQGNPVLIDKINFAVPHSDESNNQPRCFWIGYSYDDKRSFDGMMGEIRVWNKVLTAEEINAKDHFYKIDPASPGLVSYWKFNDNNTKDKVIKDYSGNGFHLETKNNANWQNVSVPEED